MKKQTASIQKSLEALVGEVDGAFSDAVAAMWAASTNRHAQLVALHARLAGDNAKIRRFILRHLELQPGESVEVGPKQYAISYVKNKNSRETFRPYLLFTVHVASGIKIYVEASPHPSAINERMVEFFLRTLDRVQRMVEAAR